MGPGEKLTSYLEGRQSDLSMFLVELGHHRVVHMIDAVIRHSERKNSHEVRRQWWYFIYLTHIFTLFDNDWQQQLIKKIKE